MATSSDIRNLPNRFFQPALSSMANGHASGLASDRLGQLVTDIDDIDQCIRIILTTPKGSDPLRPTFGSDMHLYMDYPINVARPHLVREIVIALMQWEPRIAVVDVVITLSDLATMSAAVKWEFINDINAPGFTTSIALGEIK